MNIKVVSALVGISAWVFVETVCLKHSFFSYTKRAIVSEDTLITVNSFDTISIDSVKIDPLFLPSISDLAKLRIPYLKTITHNSKIYGLEPSMVAAMIKQESKFNSNAKSHRNAIGLMQVIGKTAGHDVNRVMFKNDSPVSDSLLYDPYTNIKFGCAYLYYIKKNFLKGIEDSTSLKYCMIASYNTGFGNVLKAFIDKSDTNTVAYAKLNGRMKFSYKTDIMVQKINSSNHIEVRKMLTENLPYEETVVYLNNVLGFIEDWYTETVAFND